MSLQLGDFELDRERRQLLRSGQPVPLEPKAYEVLSLLVERRPKALSRAQIRDVVWPGVYISESTLGVAINAIRQALGDDARQPRFIRTVHGFGYAFCGEVAGEDATEGEEPGPRPAEPRSLSSFTEADADTSCRGWSSTTSTSTTTARRTCSWRISAGGGRRSDTERSPGTSADAHPHRVRAGRLWANPWSRTGH